MPIGAIAVVDGVIREFRKTKRRRGQHPQGPRQGKGRNHFIALRADQGHLRIQIFLIRTHVLLRFSALSMPDTVLPPRYKAEGGLHREWVMLCYPLCCPGQYPQRSQKSFVGGAGAIAAFPALIAIELHVLISEWARLEAELHTRRKPLNPRGYGVELRFMGITSLFIALDHRNGAHALVGAS